jgi:hypothetical protein
MAEKEPGKEWFVTREGNRFGPVSVDDLKFEAGRGELNPRLDMVWKDGMDGWIPAGEVEGLFKRNEEAKAAELAREAAFTGYRPEISERERKLIKGEWIGVGRGTYFFVCYLLPFLWMAGLGFGMGYLQGKVAPGLLGIAGLALSLVPFILIIAATLQRFQNLGMSRVWFLGLFAPLLNIWVSYRLFACPPGYAYHRKLDGIGWALAVLMLLMVAAIGFAAYTLGQAAEDDPVRIAIEGYIEEKIEEARKAREKP